MTILTVSEAHNAHPNYSRRLDRGKSSRSFNTTNASGCRRCPHTPRDDGLRSPAFPRRGVMQVASSSPTILTSPLTSCASTWNETAARYPCGVFDRLIAATALSGKACGSFPPIRRLTPTASRVCGESLAVNLTALDGMREGTGVDYYAKYRMPPGSKLELSLQRKIGNGNHSFLGPS